MKFLIDMQLSKMLIPWIRQKGHEVRHVLNLPNGERMLDTEIWNTAIQHEEIIISKDSDFFYRSQLLGRPPQVVHLVFGNCSNKMLMTYLEPHWPSLEVALSNIARLVVVATNTIKVWL